jgi:hypothetical protein
VLICPIFTRNRGFGRSAPVSVDSSDKYLQNEALKTETEFFVPVTPENMSDINHYYYAFMDGKRFENVIYDM